METSDTFMSTHEETGHMETAPCIAYSEDGSRRLLEENGRLRAEVEELREMLRRHERDERERHSMYRTGHQWHQQSWMDPNHQHFPGQSEEDMSHSTLTEHDDISLDTADNRSHDRTLNGPTTFCKHPSVSSIRSKSEKSKQSDVEEATAATTATDSSIKIAHDPTFETNYKDESFGLMMAERAGWLVGLLLFQSVSSFVLEEHQNLLQQYPVIVKFLTMLVGAGGNAGGQACVRGKQSRHTLSRA